MGDFPKFWFESNAKWGKISSPTDLSDLVEFFCTYVGHGPRTRNESAEFVGNAKRAIRIHPCSPVDLPSFGYRSEHIIGKGPTLRDWLREFNVEIV